MKQRIPLRPSRPCGEKHKPQGNDECKENNKKTRRSVLNVLLFKGQCMDHLTHFFALRNTGFNIKPEFISTVKSTFRNIL